MTDQAEDLLAVRQQDQDDALARANVLRMGVVIARASTDLVAEMERKDPQGRPTTPINTSIGNAAILMQTLSTQRKTAAVVFAKRRRSALPSKVVVERIPLPSGNQRPGLEAVGQPPPQAAPAAAPRVDENPSMPAEVVHRDTKPETVPPPPAFDDTVIEMRMDEAGVHTGALSLVPVVRMPIGKDAPPASVEIREEDAHQSALMKALQRMKGGR